MTDEDHRGVVASITSLAKDAVHTIPPAFLMLLLINVVFVLGLLLFLHQQSAPRERVLMAIVEACLGGKH
jgi:hypothetical protein